jgi:hypothetical protein
VHLQNADWCRQATSLGTTTVSEPCLSSGNKQSSFYGSNQLGREAKNASFSAQQSYLGRHTVQQKEAIWQEDNQLSDRDMILMSVLGAGRLYDFGLTHRVQCLEFGYWERAMYGPQSTLHCRAYVKARRGI